MSGSFRFHERVRILPYAVHVNIGKRGMSLSLGGPGVTPTLSKRGTRTTVGLLGTGLSYVDNEPWQNAGPTLALPTSPRRRHHWFLWLLAILATLWALGAILTPPPADAETLSCSVWQGVRTCQGPATSAERVNGRDGPPAQTIAVTAGARPIGWVARQRRSTGDDDTD